MNRPLLMLALLMAVTTVGKAEDAPELYPAPSNLPAVVQYCGLEAPGVQRLREQGLVVSPERAETNLFSAYFPLEHQGLPVYVTADAMLYLWYEAHREALLAVERQHLRPELIALVEELLQAAGRVGGPADRARQNQVMLAVTRRLLEPAWAIPGDLQAEVEAEVGRVLAHASAGFYPDDDYTQYEVRGFYTRSPEAEQYFRGAKYLARRYFAVSAERQGGENDLARAVLLAVALREGGLADLYRRIRETREYLAGPVDSIGLDLLLEACDRVWGAGWTADRVGDLGALRQELETDRYPRTRINNRLTFPENMLTRDKWVAVLGEHYLPDSELFHRTTSPEVPDRLLPSGLDVAVALGSETAAARLAETAVPFPQVAPNARAFGQSMQFSGVYGRWLGTLKTLFDKPEGLPLFARGAAYQDKQLNASLTSWAQLRHNYLLYGAQAAIPACAPSIGAGLVEPLPDFWATYAAMCKELREHLAVWKVAGRPAEVLQKLEDKALTFRRCAEDQLAGRDISWAAEHISQFGSFVMGVYFDNPLVVADVATDANTGNVLEVASGPFHPIAVLVETEGGTEAAVGWVGSYYEWAEPNLGRLTDEEWKQRLDAAYAQPEPPAWLADLWVPVAGERAGQYAELRALETALWRDEQEGREQIEAAIQADPYGPLAPGAALLLGKYLMAKARYAEAEAALAAAEEMYGGEAREAALRLRGEAQWRQRREENRVKEQAQFAAALAETDPKPGLTPAQDKERQNRRARLLLNQAFPPPLASAGSDSDRYLEQAIRECPDADLLPVIEMARLVTPWVDKAYGEGVSASPVETAREQEPLWLALARKYAGSAVGQAAQAAWASLPYAQGDPDLSLQRAQPLLKQKPPDPEPYPEAAKWLANSRWDWAFRFLKLDARSLVADILREAIPAAYYGGDVKRLRALLASADKREIESNGSLEEIAARVKRFGDDSEALAALGRWEGAWREFPPTRPVTLEERAREAIAIADRHPKSRAAPAVLYMAWTRVAVGSLPEWAEMERQLRERLAASPDTPEYLQAQIAYLTREERYDEAVPLYRRLQTLLPTGDRERMELYYLERIGASDPAQAKEGRAKYLATLQQRWGALAQAAGLGTDFLKKAKSEEAIVKELLPRLPDRQAEVLMALPVREEGTDWILRRYAPQVLGASPQTPGMAELRWRLGRTEDLLALTAGGPDTPHYEEAVTRFAIQAAKANPDLRAGVQLYGDLADRFQGTPAEALALAAAAQTYLSHERPEEGAEYLKRALARVSATALFRERLLDLQRTAEGQIAAKRRVGVSKAWEAPVQLSARRSDATEAWPTLVGERLLLAGQVAGVPGVICLEAATGKQLWATPLAGVNGMIACGDSVVVGTERGFVAALAGEDGRLLWRRDLGPGQAGQVWCTPAGDSVAAYWDQGLLCVLETATGALRWQQRVSATAAAPVVAADLVMLVTAEDRVQAWRVADGKPAWSWDWRSAVPAERARTVGARYRMALTPAGGRVVVSLEGWRGLLLALRPESGTLAWKQDPQQGSRLLRAVDGETSADFYLATEGALVACSAADGKAHWTLPTGGSGGTAGRLQVLGPAVVFSQGGRLRVLDRETGSTVQELRRIQERAGMAVAAGAGGARVWLVELGKVTAWTLAPAAERSSYPLSGRSP